MRSRARSTANQAASATSWSCCDVSPRRRSARGRSGRPCGCAPGLRARRTSTRCCRGRRRSRPRCRSPRGSRAGRPTSWVSPGSTQPLGRAQTVRAGRADQAELEHVAGARHDAACRQLLPDLHALPPRGRPRSRRGRSSAASISLGARSGCVPEAPEVSRLFAAIGRFSYRFRWPVIAVWVVAFAAGPGGRPAAAPRAQGRRLLQPRARRPSRRSTSCSAPAHRPRRDADRLHQPDARRAQPAVPGGRGPGARRRHAGQRARPADACRPTPRAATRR